MNKSTTPIIFGELYAPRKYYEKNQLFNDVGSSSWVQSKYGKNIINSSQMHGDKWAREGAKYFFNSRFGFNSVLSRNYCAC